jgi:signal transduction histidine kinase
LGILFALVGVVAVLITSIVNYVIAQESVKQDVGHQLIGIRSNKARHIETTLRDLRHSVEVIAADSSVAAAVQDFAGALKTLGHPKNPTSLATWYESTFNIKDPKQFIPSDPAAQRLQELYVVSRGNHNASDSGLDAHDGSQYSAVHRRYHRNFESLRAAFGLNDILLIDSASGRIVYSVRGDVDLGADLRSEPYQTSNLAKAFETAAGGRSILVDFYRYGPGIGEPAAFIAEPIQVDGKVVGVLAARFDSQLMDKVTSGGDNWLNQGLGRTGETIVFGRDGNMRSDSRLARTDIGDLLSKLKTRGLGKDQLDLVHKTRSTVLAFRVLLPTVLSANESATNRTGNSIANNVDRNDVVETVGYLGEPVVCTFESLTIPDLDWVIICQQDQSEAYQGLDQLRFTSMVAGLGILIATILASYLASGAFTGPLHHLMSAAHRLGRGEKGIRVPLNTQDEYGELGRTFNYMVENLERLEESASAIRRNIVHDLKAPVTVIKGMAETLKDPGFAEDAALHTEMADAIGEEAGRLLEDLQDILVPVSLEYKPDPEDFDLSLLIEAVGRAQRNALRGGRHKIIVSGTDNPVLINADRRKIRRVVENLVGNAIKYSPGEGKRIWLELTAQGERVEIIVKDEGLGMTPEQLAKVLGTGGRIAEHAKLGIEGTGLGLGSVRLILNAHGGELKVESEEGVGSAFHVILPRGRVGVSQPTAN